MSIYNDWGEDDKYQPLVIHIIERLMNNLNVMIGT